MVKFLVTTDKKRVEDMRLGGRVFMVDGTVPGWLPQEGDRHWDHHCAGGAAVQIEEMIEDSRGLPVLSDNDIIVTTQVDADACVAAALLMCPAVVGASSHDFFAEYAFYSHFPIDKLWAIAHDCDHLFVPETSPHGEFAAKAVADLKQQGFKLAAKLDLPSNRKDWTAEDKELYASTAFRKGAEWLAEAALGLCEWPGDSFDAEQYWQEVERHTAMIANDRLQRIGEAWVYDLRQVFEYVDPRAANRAIAMQPEQAASPVVLKIGDHRSVKDGIGYTLGSNPAHPLAHNLDYSSAGVWHSLTLVEALARGLSPYLVNEHWDFQAQKGLPSFDDALGFSPWGGRDKVGGSGWNTPSELSPEEVIQVVIRALNR